MIFDAEVGLRSGEILNVKIVLHGATSLSKKTMKFYMDRYAKTLLLSHEDAICVIVTKGRLGAAETES